MNSKLINNKGITLIILVITIIIIVIIGGVSVYLTLEKNGIITKAQQGQKKYEIEEIKQEIELVIIDIQTSELSNGKELKKDKLIEQLQIKLNEIIIIDESIIVEYKGYEYSIGDDYKLEYLGEAKSIRPTMEYTITQGWAEEIEINIKAITQDDQGIEKIILPDTNEVLGDTATYKVNKNGSYRFTLVGKNGKKVIKSVNVQNIYRTANTEIQCDDISKSVRDRELESGNYTFKIEDEIYKVELYNYYEDVIYTENTELGNDIPDETMLIVKYHKNLEIKEGAKLTAKTRKKGMYICVLGDINNNGEITMTAKGAIAEGQNVYLLKKTDGNYEYVPAIGAKGADSSYMAAAAYLVTIGKNGIEGQNRQTGGGGSGGVCSYSSGSSSSGRGGNGTSYSGGSGGGGTAGRAYNLGGYNGSDIGGPGGNGNVAVSGGKDPYLAGGGAGNNGGTSVQVRGSYSFPSENGTGGLLIIFANKIINNGTITSKGSNGGYILPYGNGVAGGGSSRRRFNKYICKK